MSTISAIRPGYTEILVACPRGCGNDDISVVLHEDSGTYTAATSCSACDEDVRTGLVIRPELPEGQSYQTPSWNFSAAERATIEARAKHAYDNYDGPSDGEAWSGGFARNH
jgi:hypothetical protein